MCPSECFRLFEFDHKNNIIKKKKKSSSKTDLISSDLLCEDDGELPTASVIYKTGGRPQNTNKLID